MTIRNEAPFATSVIAAGVLFSLSAAEASDEDSWGLSGVLLRNQNNYEQTRYVLYTQSSERLGAMFYCKSGNVAAYLSASPVDFADYITRNLFGADYTARKRSAEYRLGGGDLRKGNFFHFKDDNVFSAPDGVVGRQILNTVIRDEEIYLSSGRIGPVIINPPPPAPDLFNKFIDECSLSGD